jgi:hypothetical protein
MQRPIVRRQRQGVGRLRKVRDGSYRLRLASSVRIVDGLGLDECEANRRPEG